MSSGILQVYVDTLVKKAYDNWMHVIEYDGKSLMSLNENKNPDSPQNDLLTASQNHSNSFNHQLNMPSLSASISSEQPSLDPGLNVRGYNDNSGSRFPMQPQNMNVSDASFQNPQQAMPSGNYNMLPLGPQQSSMPSFLAPGTSNLASYRGADDFFTEEIRLRSHEMLGNEDMQQLLHVFNSGGSGHHPSGNVTEDGYPYASQQQVPDMSSAFGFNEDRSRSGKAVVGWLKLKAALRWGIFIRKKAAERRAQIVELDDL